MRWYHSQIQPYGFEDLAELICLLGAVPNKKIVSEEEDFAVAVRAFTRDTLLSDQVWKRRLNAPRFRIRQPNTYCLLYRLCPEPFRAIITHGNNYDTLSPYSHPTSARSTNYFGSSASLNDFELITRICDDMGTCCKRADLLDMAAVGLDWDNWSYLAEQRHSRFKNYSSLASISIGGAHIQSLGIGMGKEKPLTKC